MERLRTPLEEDLADDLLQWSIWNYATGESNNTRPGLVWLSDTISSSSVRSSLTDVINLKFDPFPPPPQSKSNTSAWDMQRMSLSVLDDKWADSHVSFQTFDGLRRRCIPTLYKCLDRGTDDDRMKGAIYTLDSNTFCSSILITTSTLG